jgi:hypothetical protein
VSFSLEMPMQPRLPRDLRRLLPWPSEYAWLSAKLPATPQLKLSWGFEQATLPPQTFCACDVLQATQRVIPPAQVIDLAQRSRLQVQL